jgi:hypothetical protein
MNYSRYYFVTDIIASIFILLFTYTGISKLLDIHSFRNTLSLSPFIGSSSYFIAWALPFVELAVSVLLFFPFARFIGLCFSLLLMTIFTFYIGFMILSSSSLPCSCGGILRQLSWKSHWLLNIILTLLTLVALLFEVKKMKSAKHLIYV